MQHKFIKKNKIKKKNHTMFSENIKILLKKQTLESL